MVIFASFETLYDTRDSPPATITDGTILIVPRLSVSFARFKIVVHVMPVSAETAMPLPYVATARPVWLEPSGKEVIETIFTSRSVTPIS